MPQKPKAYTRPTTLDEAIDLLKKPDTAPLAGGTKLLANGTAVSVVDLQDLGLNQIGFSEDVLMVGATATLAELDAFLVANGRSGDPSSLLRRAIRQAGPNTYRNAATLGGCIASRLPDSELLAALLVLEATVDMYPDAAFSMVDFLAAETKPAGLITAVYIPWQQGDGDSHRVARTPADDPIVSITGWQPQNGRIRLAATGIGERPFRLTAAEQAQTTAQAAQAAKDAATHPGDFRGSASYRAEMAAVLTKRTLDNLQL
jgi:CO/xanthine dehydrogenase FAD-binding subunit